MQELAVTADDLVERLLGLSETEPVCILDSCEGGDSESVLIAAAGAREVMISRDPENSAAQLSELIEDSPVTFFTISYDLGLSLNGIESRHPRGDEPLVYALACDAVFVHDYASGRSFFEGGETIQALPEIPILTGWTKGKEREAYHARADSDVARREYLEKVEQIKELIREGETYQTNLTQKIRVPLAGEISGRSIFSRLRRQHPSSHAAYFSRGADEVVSISPERFFKVADLGNGPGRIIACPIKGTRRRVGDFEADERSRLELIQSEKDRAENTMIVDLLRNDLGRVCRYGSVGVSSLCEIKELPTLFHLVSTVEGTLRDAVSFEDILRALFPCGSITGCPKHRTMQIIDGIEPSARGLSMGAIGYAFNPSNFPALAGLFGGGNDVGTGGICADLSVAIRTMVVRDNVAEFNVGGGIVIDSDPDAEYEESLDKASAILAALEAELRGI